MYSRKIVLTSSNFELEYLSTIKCTMSRFINVFTLVVNFAGTMGIDYFCILGSKMSHLVICNDMIIVGKNTAD